MKKCPVFMSRFRPKTRKTRLKPVSREDFNQSPRQYKPPVAKIFEPIFIEEGQTFYRFKKFQCTDGGIGPVREGQFKGTDIQFRCGKCRGCTARKAAQMMGELVAEAETSEEKGLPVNFATLTFSDEYYVYRETLDIFSDFMRSMRYRFVGDPPHRNNIRQKLRRLGAEQPFLEWMTDLEVNARREAYNGVLKHREPRIFVKTEFGARTHRYHGHAILFNCHFGPTAGPKKFFHDPIWEYGHIDEGRLEFGGIHYVANYLEKHLSYGTTNFEKHMKKFTEHRPTRNIGKDRMFAQIVKARQSGYGQMPNFYRAKSGHCYPLKAHRSKVFQEWWINNGGEPYRTDRLELERLTDRTAAHIEAGHFDELRRRQLSQYAKYKKQKIEQAKI